MIRRLLAARAAKLAARAESAASILAESWVPVVDVSEHNDVRDFRRMRGQGVRGVILRACHGLDVDDRALGYYEAARAAGFAGNEIGWYLFINPKRGSGAQCAEVLCSTIIRATAGEWAPFTMIDAEGYRNEPPSKGQAPVSGPAYSAWLLEHQATTAAILPDTNRIGYTNAAFWDPFVGDAELAAQFDWIVPRYPVYTPAGYLLHPLPEPARWHEWAAYWAGRGKAPLAPTGAADWDGWQCSAGWNLQGSRYGCGGRDLDINIIRARSWARWTSRPTTPGPISPSIPQEDDDMPKLIRPDGDAAVFAVSGIHAVWAVSGDTITTWQGVGVWDTSPVQVVPRSALRALVLCGPEPDYTGVALPGRTTAADFAAHVTTAASRPPSYALSATLTPVESA